MYLDLLMALNFVIDYILLLGTNSLAGFSAEYRRMIPAALLGAVYSGGCMIPGFFFLREIYWRIVCLMLMAAVAFGIHRNAWKRGGIFVLLNLALGGLATMFELKKIPELLISAALIFCLSKLAFGGRTGSGEYIPIEICHDDKKIQIMALRDTGNHLRDPISGEQVMVIGDKEAIELTGLTPKQLNAPLETIVENEIPGLRLIPYKTVGQGAGMMLAMRFSKVCINGKKRPVVVAFAPCGLGGNMYQALVGGTI